MNTFLLNMWVRKREVCSVTVLFVLLQGSLNSTMDSLKAELNTALQCDREAEEEVKKLKVDVLQSPAHVENVDRWEHLHLSLEPCLNNSACIFLGAHRRSEAAHRGPVQRPAPVPVPGGEAAAGEAEDRGAQRADPPGRAQGSAVRGDIPSAEGCPGDRGEAERAGLLHSAPGEFSNYGSPAR